MKSLPTAFFFSLLAGVAALCLWPYVRLPFANPEGFVGPLTEIGFNPANNILRFLLVVLAPALCLLIFCVVNRARISELPELAAPRGAAASPLDAMVYYAGLALIAAWALICLASFLSGPFPSQPLDVFHEGEHLTPAFNYWTTGGMWTRSFFVHGLVYDCLCDVWAWKLFGAISIGAARFMHGLWTALIPASLALFLIAMAASLRQSVGALGAAFVPLAIVVGLYLTNMQLHFLDRRDCLVLAASACLLLFLARRRKWLLCAAALLCALQVFVTIDRAAYAVAGVVGVVAVDGLFRRDFRALPGRLGLFLAVYAGTLAAVFACLGGREAAAFFDNAAYFIRYKDYIDSYEYLPPLAARAQLVYVTPVVSIVLQGLVLVRLAFVKSFRNSAPYLAGLLCALLAALYFRSALGRSDPMHVMYASTFAYIGLFYWAALLVFYFSARLAPYVCLLLFSVVGVWIGSEAVELGRRWDGWEAASRRIGEYAALNDEAFLTEGGRRLCAGLQAALRDEKSLFVYTSEAAWPYLLRKPSHNKYFVVWFAASLARQRELVEGLRKDPPRDIIFQSDAASNCFDGIPSNRRFPELHAYLASHYVPFDNVENIYFIYRRKAAVE